VQNAARIVVTDSQQERYAGEVVGTDPDTDIAVVRIDAAMPVIELGDSDDLQVGQMVVAIGSPYGLSQSVSSGVISAIGRSLPDSFADSAGLYPLVDVIQTDAAINPGNSGGPLVDRAGMLIGISSAIYSESGASDGVGFAIPVNNAVSIAEQLIETGSAEHPFLGVVGRDVNPAVAEEEKLPVDEGALIIEVTKGTEAEKAGVKPDDIIVGIDDDKIRSMDDLILQVRRRKIGDTVTLKLYRAGKEMELEMTVGIKPKNLELPTEEATPSP
ncbi:MAG: S1C family serine protease, partial [Coriobacteriia bacterium]